MVENNPDLGRYDHLEIYCRKLGHDVPFRYCRKPGDSPFCSRLPLCWEGKLDGESYIKEHYTEEEIAAAQKPPQPKIVSLYELIQKAQSQK